LALRFVGWLLLISVIVGLGYGHLRTGMLAAASKPNAKRYGFTPIDSMTKTFPDE
jgi:hypothetical protein